MNDSFQDILAELTGQPLPPEAEVVVDARTGRPRQAGAASPEGEFITRYRSLAERSLYFFAKAILKRAYLTDTLHKPVCDWLQRVPPHRKQLLMPREHGKTSLVSHALPIHILLQPADANLYWPGLAGADMRIVLACETENRAKDHLRTIQTAYESNELLKALWPHLVWDDARAQSKKWNDRELIMPRMREFPDPSIRAIGVGGAITGSHPTVLIKDDLATLEAANSPTVMQTAIAWHIASRALISEDGCLEFSATTKWAMYDIAAVGLADPTVETNARYRAVLEDGRAIYDPARLPLSERGKAWTPEKIEKAKRDHGVMFPLLYMNSAADPSLVDFNMAFLREFRWDAGALVFEEDHRDAALSERLKAPPPAPPAERGTRLSSESHDRIFGREEYFRYGRVRSA